jgi:hypothetical protein
VSPLGPHTGPGERTRPATTAEATSIYPPISPPESQLQLRESVSLEYRADVAESFELSRESFAWYARLEVMAGTEASVKVDLTAK